ncbi:MAG: TlpA disulfide reductase family protein [Burkholderiales bacterium]
MVLLPRRLILAVLAACLLLGGCGQPQPAPEVTFVSLQGERIAVRDLVGKVVIVKFWATDCAVCVKEMPDMARTYVRYRDRGLEFIAVAMQHDPPNYVIRYAESNRLPFKVALDPTRELAKAYGDVKVTPTTFVIDRRGNIVSRTQGESDLAKFYRLLEEKLKEPA